MNQFIPARRHANARNIHIIFLWLNHNFFEQFILNGNIVKFMQDVILFFSVGYLYLFDCTEKFKFQETKTTNG